MSSYFLKLSDRAEGPFSEAQIAQLFADGRIDRHTLCRTAAGGDWRTVDDFLPMLKYGPQLPVPTSGPPPAPGARPETPPPFGSSLSTALPPAIAPPFRESRRIALVEIDLPFFSILRLTFKWMAAAFLVFCCFLPAVVFLLFVVMAIFGSLLGHMFSGFQNP